jgi:hypothetical protein
MRQVGKSTLLGQIAERFDEFHHAELWTHLTGRHSRVEVFRSPSGKYWI